MGRLLEHIRGLCRNQQEPNAEAHYVHMLRALAELHGVWNDTPDEWASWLAKRQAKSE